MRNIFFSAFFILLTTFSSNGFSKIKRNFTNNHNILNSPVVISLERHRFRFYETKKLMENAGFFNIQLFNAIDGFDTDEIFFNELNILKGSPGQKGCAASHLTIWREFFEDADENDYLFVCEDDMLPHSKFKELFPFYWSKTPEDFDIVMVGNGLKFDFQQSKKGEASYLVSYPTFCAHAYIISKKGAKKLYNLYSKIPSTSAPFSFIIDGFLYQAMVKKQIEFYCYEGRFFPDLTNQKNGKIWKRRDTGICFQNTMLGTTIFSQEYLPYDENMYQGRHQPQ